MQVPPYIDRFRARNYRCIQSCALKLTPLHALVGPNDSGKSTLLRALELAQRSFAVDAPLLGFRSSAEFLLCWQDEVSVRRWDKGPFPNVEWKREGALIGSGVPRRGLGLEANDGRYGPARLVRFDVDELRQPTPLLPSASGIAFANERGRGLASVYDALLARHRRAFDAIERLLVQLFPAAAGLVLTSLSESTKVLGVRLRERHDVVHAPEMSEGMLYFLAFAALLYVEHVPLVLLEEPEKGIHPVRITEVMGLLRQLSTTTQVIVATHSPLVLNELHGDEISVITRDERGTHAVTLSDTPHYRERAAAYRNGEIWLACADGKQERVLVTGASA